MDWVMLGLSFAFCYLLFLLGSKADPDKELELDVDRIIRDWAGRKDHQP